MNLVQISQRLEITFWSATIVMLKNRRALRIVIAAIVLAFVLLIVSSIARYFSLPVVHTNRSSMLAPASHNIDQLVEANSQRQYNTLIILVDELDLTANAENMVIQGVWLAAYLPSDMKVNFVPLFQSERTRYSQDHNKLKLDHYGAPSKEFVASVARLDVHWDHYVVIDFTVMNEFIDNLLKGEQGSASFDLSGSQVVQQAIRADILCSYTRIQFQNGNSHKLLQSFRGKFYSDLDLSYVSALFQRAQANRPMFTCEFPTLGDKVSAKLSN